MVAINKKLTKFIKIKLLFILCFITILSGEKPLSIGFWNVENLFDLQDDPIKNDDEFAIGGRKNVDRNIYDLKIEHC